MSEQKRTFSQRQGIVELPSQMKLREIDNIMKSKLWRAFRTSLDAHQVFRQRGDPPLRSPWNEIWESWEIEYLENMVDSPVFYRSQVGNQIKVYIEHQPYNIVFDFIEFVLQHQDCPFDLSIDLHQVFRECRPAYHIIDEMIVPVSEESEVEGIKTAVSEINSSPAMGVKTHMASSTKHLRAGDWGSSIRESITAVESAARFVAPGTKDLAGAMVALEKSGQLKHPAMKQALSKLYGYTSDEQGIRHALVFAGTADVDESEAIFMFGACASFASYLLKFSPPDD
ncbi:hypothetical protein GCM10009096_10450 [Parasphingorhabdus litoris]|uniref:HEPN AbiJ-N-terminal domain-containing protein n=1 Tax=Parasphingorhabdus litoris TaxID=394733 RepID=A0ABN1AA53_9SPHN|nr:hypothetical protein [Parasphingorhabdus litoris]